LTSASVCGSIRVRTAPDAALSLHDTGGAATPILRVHGGPGAVSRPGVPRRLPMVCGAIAAGCCRLSLALLAQVR
jgi:hypothetical protein